MPTKQENEAIQNLKSTEDLSKAINNLGKETEKTFKSSLDMVKQIGKAYKNNLSDSKEELDVADKMNKYGVAVINHMQKQNFWTKTLLRIAEYRLKKTKGTKDEHIDIVDALKEQFKWENKNKGNSDKKKKSENEILDSLKSQFPIFGKIKVFTKANAHWSEKAVAAYAVGLKILTPFAELVGKIGERFGAIGVMKFKTDLLDADVAAKRLGKGMDDVTTTIATLTNEFGISLHTSIDLSESVLDTSVALGLSADEGAKLIGTLTKILGLSVDSADQFAKQVSLLAEAEGVSPVQVLKDIAGSSAEVAKFTKDSGENIAQAAIQARKLGVSFSITSQIAGSLLDFQTSIEAELQASVLIGRQLNLQRARELALSGEIAEMTREIVKQVGSEAEFNKLNAIQRDELSKAIGISTDQLAKFVNNQERGVTLAEKLSKQKGFEELVGRRALDSIAQLTNNLKSIAAAIINVVAPAVSQVTGLVAGLVGKLADLDRVLKGIGGIITAVLTSKAIKPLFSLLSFFVGPGKYFKVARYGIAGAVGLASATGALSDFEMKPGGQTVISSPAGTYTVNPKDTIVGGTAMGGGNTVLLDAINKQTSVQEKTNKILSSLELNTDITNKDLKVIMTPRMTE